MRIEVLFLFLGMLCVTYIPRFLPAVFMGKLKLGKRVEKFLSLVPYTAMASLIFPGVVFVDERYAFVGLVGGAVAGLLAWKKVPVMLCVIAAILSDLLIYLFIR